jgi:hypothetical protein
MKSQPKDFFIESKAVSCAGSSKNLLERRINLFNQYLILYVFANSVAIWGCLSKN